MPEKGYRRLFINLGKDDGFYPGEVMQFINRNVHGRQDVGHIDLLARISYIEVPEEDAQKVMRALNGASYRGRTVRCNDADDTPSDNNGGRQQRRSGSDRGARGDRRSSRRDMAVSMRSAQSVATTVKDEDVRSVEPHALRAAVRTTGASSSTIPTSSS